MSLLILLLLVFVTAQDVDYFVRIIEFDDIPGCESFTYDATTETFFYAASSNVLCKENKGDWKIYEHINSTYYFAHIFCTSSCDIQDCSETYEVEYGNCYSDTKTMKYVATGANYMIPEVTDKVPAVYYMFGTDDTCEGPREKIMFTYFDECPAHTFCDMNATGHCDCEGGFISKTGPCYNCDAMEECLTCYSADNCSDCDTGFFLKSDSTGCDACGDNCAECTSETVCQVCNEDYFESAGDCVLCTTIDHCLECNNAGECTDCDTGYFEATGDCTACPTNCLTCTSSEACQSCKTGFKGATCTEVDEEDSVQKIMLSIFIVLVFFVL